MEGPSTCTLQYPSVIEWCEQALFTPIHAWICYEWALQQEVLVLAGYRGKRLYQKQISLSKLNMRRHDQLTGQSIFKVTLS